MHTSYHDIREKIAEDPRWWDEHAVPRYCEFSPNEIANIYASECCLLLIHCQSCGTPYSVAMSSWRFDSRTIGYAIEEGSIHYGDPPNDGCCAAGPTMNSIPIRVIEFWHRPHLDWVRVSELERTLEEGGEAMKPTI